MLGNFEQCVGVKHNGLTQDKDMKGVTEAMPRETL